LPVGQRLFGRQISVIVNAKKLSARGYDFFDVEFGHVISDRQTQKFPVSSICKEVFIGLI
jgi:hypothetical protein